MMGWPDKFRYFILTVVPVLLDLTVKDMGNDIYIDLLGCEKPMQNGIFR